MENFDTLILGGAPILDYAAVADRCASVRLVVCADSGYDHCAALALHPHLLVGDFDSVRGVLPEGLPRLALPSEKDHTDTTHAVEEALRRGARRILLAGMLGGRMDHTLANLQSLAFLTKQGRFACLTDGRTDVYAVRGPGQIELPRRERYYFSLLSLTERCEGVWIRGAKYPLSDYTLLFDNPRAISNEFLSGPAAISLTSGIMAVLCVPMDFA